MTLLQKLNTVDLGDGISSKPAVDMLIAGDPAFTTWNQVEAKEGTIVSGVWEATPGLTKSIKGKRFEFCHLLEGEVELTEEGHAPVIFRAGDAFVMKPGYVGTWRTIKTVRKIYVIVD